MRRRHTRTFVYSKPLYALAPFFPSRERERPVLNPALALGAPIRGLTVGLVARNCAR